MSSKLKLLCMTVFVFSCVTLSSSLFAQTPDGQLPPEVITTLDDAAKDLAALLAHPGIRNQLRAAVNRSTRREKILLLDELLSSISNVPGLPAQARGKANEALTKAGKAKQRFTQLKMRPDIDVYFPVPNHRDKWTGGDDVLVAVGTLDDNPTQVKVYSVKTQQPGNISGAAPPAEPVLFVSLCEHETHNTILPLPVGDVPQTKAAQPPQGNQSYIATTYFKITNDHEPWTSGDPEIYVLVAQARADGTTNKFKRYLNAVNRENVWYDLANCPTDLSFYWDSTYTPTTYYKVMEEDPGILTTSLIGLAVGGPLGAVAFAVNSGDDSLGQLVLDRNTVGWSPYGIAGSCQMWISSFSTGDAWMRMCLAH